MMKLVTGAFALFAMGSGFAHAEPLDGAPVALFPKLTWGLSEQAALSKGLKAYAKANTKTDVIGLPSVTIGDIDFSAQAVFGKKETSGVRSGLNSIVLQHEGAVPKGKYEKFIRLITNGFLYAGQGSAINQTASFYNAIDGGNYLVVTTTDRAKSYLSVAIAPGVSK